MVFKRNYRNICAALISFALLSNLAFAQEQTAKIYSIPVNELEHTIKLVLLNSTGERLNDVIVKVANAPSWIKIKNEEVVVSKLDADEEFLTTFSFVMTGKTIVGDTASIDIIATNKDGFVWEKIIWLSPDAPSEFELLPNYPNPFNPTTTIRYRLPVQMTVSAGIYNILGRKIATFAEGVQQAGQYEYLWNASNMASGLYFFRISARDNHNKRIFTQRKMMLIK